MRILLLNEYTLGLATLLKASGEFADATCIVVGADWNAYTRDAKQHCLDNELGLFVFNELFGAIHLDVFYAYAKKDDRGQPTYPYRGT
jgi:hypothetical protein